LISSLHSLAISSYACHQLLPKIHEQELEILDGVMPALMAGFPSRHAPYGVVVKRFSFGEVGAFWDTTFRVCSAGNAVIVVRCNHLERL
jgi:hypothetical protein